MPLSLNEIRERARSFAREWAAETSERAEAQSFWNDFFDVFGIKRRSVAVYEQKAQRFSGSQHGRIDVFWPGVLLAEHKSEGRDLDAAFDQATDYFAGIKEAERPRYILVSDFRRFVLHDLDSGERVAFALADLHREIGRFGFISGYQTRHYKEEDPVNVQAAERMGKLHDALKAAGYDGHALELLLVRLLFCLFADDTGIFPRQAFHDLISQRTSEDGSDLGMWIARVFQVLDTAPERRQATLDEQLAELPWVNGKLFAEMLPLADFNTTMRGLLLDACQLDWGRISPAIFGSMFQSVMDAKARRNLGAHYTSEKNILKLIGPLFLDGLKEELCKAGNDDKKLAQLHRKLASLKFLDPACGCGNFLVIAYRELRALELEVLKRQFARQHSLLAHVQDHVLVDVDQFHGIEIEEFPAQIAQVALWLMDHQMNLRVAEQFGENVLRLPLKKSAAIVHGNALRINWNEVVAAEELDFILGNPPFVGKKEQNAEQKADMAAVFAGVKGAGVLDFVSAWYLKAAQYLKPLSPRERGWGEGKTPSSGAARHLPPAGEGTGIRCAFVSTNSITQGEQVGVLWGELYRLGMHIQFAHRTFKWSNEARGVAAVHCVIVGFGHEKPRAPALYDYEHVNAEPQLIEAVQINPYLVDADEVFVLRRDEPLCAVPEISKGSEATDFGHLFLDADERLALLSLSPQVNKFLRSVYGSDELINGLDRWCLWLVDASPAELRAMPEVMRRIELVRRDRSGSGKARTREWAGSPSLFTENRQPKGPYLAIPKVSSERRNYLPMMFMTAEQIATGSLQLLPEADVIHFGVLSSAMHMAWMRYTCGRMKSDYQYSNTIVYNNFPWPQLEPLSHRERGRGEGKPYPPKEAIEFARNLRRDGTDAEQRLWQLLRNRHLGDFKFRRQHPLPPYTLDFYCDAAKLCVELDGGQHADAAARDARRDAFLQAQGIRTLRVWNNEVMQNLEAVLQAIWNALHEAPSSGAARHLLPEGEESRAPSPPRPLPGGEESQAPSPSAPAVGEGSKLRAAIETAAQAVLDARAQFPDSTLADLYDPLTMPPALVKAHAALDKAVDAAYLAAEKAAGRKAPKLSTDAQRVAFLFQRYQALVNGLLAMAPARRGRAKRPPA
ncbi:MAG: DUF559 domain-containing protein [Dokdonella sp.]|uniref:DNA methyltransferase n=1 Tax=Dokdonella sp. TaxID=2291710 RepID=UPI0025B8D5F2|nr:DNA methyltransferase [Dokdonella sp.]MBZ0222630.1 DUF559 domain-containing protein [Dokdonella sp.]